MDQFLNSLLLQHGMYFESKQKPKVVDVGAEFTLLLTHILNLLHEKVCLILAPVYS